MLMKKRTTQHGRMDYMNSPLLIKTSKSQLAAEHLSTTTTTTKILPPNKTDTLFGCKKYIQRERGSHNKMIEQAQL